MTVAEVQWKAVDLIDLQLDHRFAEIWDTWIDTEQFSARVTVSHLKDGEVGWTAVIFVRRPGHLEAVVERGDAGTAGDGKRRAEEAAFRVGTDPETHPEAIPVPSHFLHRPVEEWGCGD